MSLNKWLNITAWIIILSALLWLLAPAERAMLLSMLCFFAMAVWTVSTWISSD